MMTAVRTKGFIKFFDEDRGFGFIVTNDRPDLFMHVTEWIEDDLPRRGERVSFIEGVGGNKGPIARQVMRIGAQS